MNKIRITESPRDAQQGLPFVIPPEQRARYINELMKAGFDVIDFGSFVSSKAIPQMSDSDKVLSMIDRSGSATRLLAIVGNLRGAEEAARQEGIDIIGFPYAVSNTFLRRNINTSVEQAIHTTEAIADLCGQHNKQLRVFISMAFGNPYGDPWSEQLVADSVALLVAKGVSVITLSDTIGLATPESIRNLFTLLVPRYPHIELGLHLHTEEKNWFEKVDAAWKAGCRSFDGVINGIGGCPMTGYELLGNLNTLHLLHYLEQCRITHQLNGPLINRLATAYNNFLNISS